MGGGAANARADTRFHSSARVSRASRAAPHVRKRLPVRDVRLPSSWLLLAQVTRHDARRRLKGLPTQDAAVLEPGGCVNGDERAVGGAARCRFLRTRRDGPDLATDCCLKRGRQARRQAGFDLRIDNGDSSSSLSTRRTLSGAWYPVSAVARRDWGSAKSTSLPRGLLGACLATVQSPMMLSRDASAA
jgi:hypothetical protein